MPDPLRDYLNQIGKIPLLTAAEEIELGNSIQRMMPLLDKPNPTKEEQKVIRIGKRAKKRMVQGNLRLVISVASKYNKMTSRLSMQDLIQEGNIGLIRAVEMFDPSRGYKFSTYAYWWIRQGIMRATQTQDRMIKLPSGAPDGLRKVKYFMIDYQKEHGVMPTLKQCADLIGVQPETMRNYLQAASDATSLDAKAKSRTDDGCSIIDLIQSTYGAADEDLELGTAALAIKRAFGEMTERERIIITMRYGLDGEEPLSNPSIAKKIGIHKEAARKLVHQTENKLRDLLMDRPPGKSKRQKNSSSLTWGWG
jgi:RNA polymerase sigma factor (sigma-70 family)